MSDGVRQWPTVTTTTVELTSVRFLFSSFFLEINAMFSVDPKEGGWGVPEYDARLERKNGNSSSSSSSSGVGSKMYKRKVLWLTRRIKQRCVLRLLHHWLRRKSQQQQQQEQQVCLVIGCCCFLLFPTHPFPLPTSADVEFFEIVVIDLFDPDTFVYIAVQHRRQQHPHRILPSLGTAVDPCGATYDRRKVVMV